ncbi:MAG: hypothetical protein FJZ96_04100 [Chloroflexi bacterium]|nr:hypothetical protein [Chloroflexota bacterium]
MLPEYDFSGKKGVRGKHARAMRGGYSVAIHKQDGVTLVQNYVLQEDAVLLDPDVREYFPDTESVNRALRTLIALFPENSRAVREGKVKFGE